MSSIMKKFFIAASAAGMSAIATAPSFAYTITGSGDAWLYDNNYGDCGPSSTCRTDDMNRLNAILGGNSSTPGGNVELFATSEGVNLANFQSSGRTSVEGTVAGKSLTLSSLTYSDWFSTGSVSTTAYGAANLANTWFNAFYDAAGISTNLNTILSSNSSRTVFLGQVAQITGQNWSFLTNNQIQALSRAVAYNTFLSDQVKGFQRSSDPNISYITTSGSDLLIGLAGHFDAKTFYASQLGPFGSLINNGFQVSEVVKAQYGSNPAQFLYSFSATQTNLREVGDGLSHSGNYEVALRGVVTPPAASVPEPSVVFGLIGLGGLLAAKRKQQQAG
jgi:hypothetical protein